MRNALVSTDSLTAAGRGPLPPSATAACVEELPMRETLIAVRDTLLVVGLQIVFRIALVLRRWNY